MSCARARPLLLAPAAADLSDRIAPEIETREAQRRLSSEPISRMTGSACEAISIV